MSQKEQKEVAQWLIWAREFQNLAQTGLTYAKDPYDIKRYERIRDLAVEIVTTHSSLEHEYLDNLYQHDLGHPTPKVDVRAAVFQDDKILLVRETSDGLWTLPGGWADPGEAPGVAVAREVFEESGFQIKVTKLLAVYDRDKHGHPPSLYTIYKIFFSGEIVGGVATQSIETNGVGFFAEYELPELSLTRMMPHQIARMFAFHRDPGLPADFD